VVSAQTVASWHEKYASSAAMKNPQLFFAEPRGGGGGQGNVNSGGWSTIAGGIANEIDDAVQSVIVGGERNPSWDHGNLRWVVVF